MLQGFVLWLLVVAFFGAGLFNAIGTAGTQDDFARWGYPRWWCRVAGGLEILTAALIALSASRSVGVALGAIIIAAAIATVLRCREFSHTAPLGVFAALLVLTVMTS